MAGRALRGAFGKTIKRVMGKGRTNRISHYDGRRTHNNPASVKMPASTQAKLSIESNTVELPLHVKDPFAIKNPLFHSRPEARVYRSAAECFLHF
jgi:hypothetical protein